MSFRIAHLSDPHLPPAPFPGGREWRLKRFLGWVNWNRGRRRIADAEMLARLVADLRAQQPDHVVMTGDAVNLALRCEFVRAGEWMKTLGPEVSFTPGNHDAYVTDALAPLRQTFWPWTEGYRFPYLKRRGEIALIGLNSGVPTPPFLATGRLGAAQLATFRTMLKDTFGLARVVMIHHPPMRGGKAPWLRGLDDARAFEDVIAEAGAELILHGHTHRAMAHALPTPTGFAPVLGAPSASSRAPDAVHRACYYVIDLEKDGAQWRVDWRARGLVMEGDGIGEREAPHISANPPPVSLSRSNSRLSQPRITE